MGFERVTVVEMAPSPPDDDPEEVVVVDTRRRKRRQADTSQEGILVTGMVMFGATDAYPEVI